MAPSICARTPDPAIWASVGLLQWSADEGAWVDQGAPADCYREAWARYDDAVQLYEGAAEAFDHAIFHPEMALSQGTSLSEQADAALVETGVLMGSAAC